MLGFCLAKNVMFFLYTKTPTTLYYIQWGVKWKKSVIPFVTWWHLEISFIQSCCLFNAVWRWTSFSWWGGKNHWTFFFKCHSKFVTETSIKEWRQIKTGFGKKGEPWERGNYSILKKLLFALKMTDLKWGFDNCGLNVKLWRVTDDRHGTLN